VETYHANFSLIHFPIFVATWVTFFIAAIISFLAQVNFFRQKTSFLAFIKHCFPFDSWSKKSARIDVFMYFASKFTDKIYGSVTLLATVFVSLLVRNVLEFAFPDHAALPFGYMTILVCSVVVFVVGDFANYVSHYLQHFVPALWELHKVHHSATFLNPLTTARMHPLGNAFDGVVSATLDGIPIGIFGFLFGFTVPDALILAANANLIGTIAVLDVLRHSHFPVSFGPLDRVILSPHMHQLHHSAKLEHWDRNFGNKLSIWDWCFGTVVKPSKDEEFIYGLGNVENQDYDKLTGVYFGPIIKIWNLIVGKSTRQPEGGVSQAGPVRISLAAGVLWRKPPEAEDTVATGPTSDNLVRS